MEAPWESHGNPMGDPCGIRGQPVQHLGLKGLRWATHGAYMSQESLRPPALDRLASAANVQDSHESVMDLPHGWSTGASSPKFLSRLLWDSPATSMRLYRVFRGTAMGNSMGGRNQRYCREGTPVCTAVFDLGTRTSASVPHSDEKTLRDALGAAQLTIPFRTHIRKRQ